MYSWQTKFTTVDIVNDDWVGPPIQMTFRTYRATPISTEAEIGLSLGVNMSLKRWLDAAALSWTMYLKGFNNLLRSTR